MPDQSVTWLSYVPAVTAVAAAMAAIASLVSIRANASAFRGKLLSDLLDEYATEDMRVAMVALSEYQDDPSKLAPNEQQRRKVSHYFQKVYTLWKAGTVSRSFVRQAISKDQSVRFLGLEPMERGINSQYDRGPFQFYAKLHGLTRGGR
jgi:hypothetical protein